MDKKQLQPLLPDGNSKRLSNAPHLENLGRSKIKRVATACESCKRRRSKCTGHPAPCKLCLQAGLECTFDPSLDGRRTWHREDREALMLQNRILTSLVQVIRFSSPSQVEAVIEYIRQDQSGRDIIDTVHESLQQPEDTCKGRSRAVASPSESHRQELTSRFDAADKDRGADSPSLRRDNTNQDHPDHVIVISECPQGNQGKLLTDQPDECRKFCPRCNQLLLVQVDAITTPESVQDYQAATQVNVACLQERRSRPGGPQPAGQRPPAVSSGSLSGTEKRESDTSDIQSARHGWHFSLQPELQAIPPAEAAASIQTEEEKPGEQDSAFLVGTQQPDQDTVSADIFPGPMRTNPAAVDVPHPSYHQVSPLYGIQTLVAQDETPLSKIIVGYRDAARNLISNGANPTDILGSDAIDVELFFRDRGSDDQFTVSNWACEVWRSFDDWDVFVRLAHILAYTVVMRWMLDSTAMSYAAIPDLLKPRPIQYLVTHHIALDFLPLPPLRQALIRNLRDWMTALPLAKLKVNWTRGMDEAVVWDEQHQRRRLSQDFVKHVTNYQNWSIEEGILAAFPEVKGMIRIDRVPNS